MPGSALKASFASINMVYRGYVLKISYPATFNDNTDVNNYTQTTAHRKQS